MRSVLRRGWNTAYATGKYNGKTRIITPFRAVRNSGDFLARKEYVCGGSNPSDAMKPGKGPRFRSFINACDTSKVPASNCNVKYVADSSDYTRFRKEQAFNRNYNDLSNGGYNNSAYVNIMAIRR
jgi:hypothetical protein